MKTIGLIGGMSWESSAEYYRHINQLVHARLGGHNNAQSLMATVNFEEIKAMQFAGRWEDAAERMAAAARQLQAGGADFIVLCTNTMHKVAAAIESATDLPFLHIADPTGAAIRAAGIRTIALLGTAFTMEQEFYRRRLADKFGLTVLVPSASERKIVHDVIYDELCKGTVRDASREAYRSIIRTLQEQGAEGVILGCTEIALLIGPDDSPIPVFDTTRLHCEAAVNLALAA
ncbi:aspartate/glutamate racemase family protein [Oxalobacteraceae bacterium OM1]|nr:aspartate/glutamate racemase family protein [Oxalobacteraceae bacterium OM1]